MSESQFEILIPACIAIGLIAIAITLISRRTVFAFVSFLALGVLLGLYSGFQCILACDAIEDDIVFEDASVVADSEVYENVSYTLIDLLTENSMRIRIRLIAQGDRFYAGEVVSGCATFKPIKEDEREKMWLRGICLQARVKDVEVSSSQTFSSAICSLRKEAIEILRSKSDESSSLIEALACGYKGDIANNGLYDRFKTCGLAHVVAVSGAHLSIISALLVSICSIFRLSKKTSIALTIAFLLTYLVFAGMPISGIRAACMSILSMLAIVSKRRSDTLNALSLMILAFVIFDPSSSVSVSMFLSVASTLGIVLFASLVSSWLSFVPKRFNDAIREPLALTTSSSILCQGPSCALFSQLSVISPLANVVVAPLFLISCVASLICAISTLMPKEVFEIVFCLASIVLIPLQISVNALSSIPNDPIPISFDLIPTLVVSILATVLLWVVWPTMKTICVIAISLITVVVCANTVLAQKVADDDQIIMLDVGQGDSFLIKSGRKSVLIDTGNNDIKLRSELSKYGVKKLDAVLITHPDDDHCASLTDLFSYVEVKQVWVSDELLDCECSKCRKLISMVGINNGLVSIQGIDFLDRIKIGKFELLSVWPERFVDDGGNADSLCLLCSFDDDQDGSAEYSVLFTGDAESEQLEKMIESSKLGDIDILKVGHHGSKPSLSEESLSSLNPDIALISVGKSNRYGHPTKTTLDLLDEYDVNVYRTDEIGSVDISYHDCALYMNGLIVDH